MAVYLNAKRKSHSLNPLTGGSLNHNFNLVLTIDNCQKNFLKETAWKEENLVMKIEGIIALNKWQIGSKIKHTLEIPGVVIILHVSESMWKHSQLSVFQDWEGCLKAMHCNCGCKMSNFARMTPIPLPFLHKHWKQQRCHFCIGSKTNDLLCFTSLSYKTFRFCSWSLALSWLLTLHEANSAVNIFSFTNVNVPDFLCISPPSLYAWWSSL